jgi:peptide/nickel transport system substrate-binding protein
MDIRALVKILSILFIISLFLITMIPLNVVNAQLPLPSGVKREEVLVLDTQVSRVANPNNYNRWVIGAPTNVVGLSQGCLDTLWYVNFTTGTVDPIVAAGLPEYNSDYSVMIVKLRKGMVWNNGRGTRFPMTAWDWVFGINATKANKNLIAYATVNTWVETAWVIDDYTFAVKLKKSNPYFHYYLTLIGPGIYDYVMPMQYFRAKGLKFEEVHTDDYNPPLCIGPYVLDSYDPGGTWFLWRRRDDWVNSSVGWMVGRTVPWPGPKYVLFRVFPSESEKIIAMIRGELDWIFDATPQAFKAIKGQLGDRVIAWYRTWPYFWGYPTSNRGIYFNNMRYPYNISAVRWALAFAINMTRVLALGYEGTQRAVAIPASVTEPSTMFWDPQLIPIISEWSVCDVVKGVTLPSDICSRKIWDPDVALRVNQWAVKEGYIKEPYPESEAKRIWGRGWWKYMPDVAEAILKALGFYKGSDGYWRLPNGTIWKIPLNVPSGFEMDAVQLGYAVAEEWRRFGIQVEVIPYESTTFWTYQFNYGAFSVGSYWGFSGNDPWSTPIFLEGWRCDYVRPIGNYSPNAARYCNSEFDKYVLLAQSYSPVSKESIEATKQALIIFIKDMPVIWMGNCKKLQPILTDYWTNWPAADNFYWGQDFWGKQTVKYVLAHLIPVKAPMDIIKLPIIRIGPGQPLPQWTPPSGVKFVQELFTPPIYLTPTPTISSPTPTPTTPSPSPTPTPTPAPTPTPTTPKPTPTPTPTPSPTTPITGVATITVVVTQSVEKTIVSTSTILSTTISTIISTTSTTIREIEWTTTIAIAVILLIIGLTIGIFIKRR